MKTTLSTLAVTATTSIDNVLLLLAKELEAHKELIESLTNQITQFEARECLRELESLRSGRDERDTDIREIDERLSGRMDAVEVSVEDKLDDMNTRLDRIDCDLEDKLNSMDVEERVTEALQNVTFTVSVD